MDIHKKYKYIQKNHIFTTLKQKYILKKEKYLKLQNLKKNKKQKNLNFGLSCRMLALLFFILLK